jgi:hypothetical protein
MIYVIAVGLCVIFFGLGIAIGIVIQQRREADAHLLIDKVSADCASRLAETAAMSKIAHRLNDACVGHHPRLSDNIRHGSDFVVRAAEALKKQLEVMTKLTAAFRQSRMKQSKALADGDEVSGAYDGQRDQRTLFIDRHPRARSKHSSSQNLHLNMWQYVAQFDGHTIPRPEAFELVHCSGLSSEGFSYFARTPPVFQKVIVAVGSPTDLQFSVAEILRTRTAREEGEQGFLSTCLITHRLEDVYKWNSPQCRIVMCADLAHAV